MARGSESGLLDGSGMSNKQMTTSCRLGRRIEFRWYQTNPYHSLAGYLVGMDSYHWLVAVVGDDEEVSVVMIHKASPDSILVSGHWHLDDESAHVQDQIEVVGGRFRALVSSRDQEPQSA